MRYSIELNLADQMLVNDRTDDLNAALATLNTYRHANATNGSAFGRVYDNRQFRNVEVFNGGIKSGPKDNAIVAAFRAWGAAS